MMNQRHARQIADSLPSTLASLLIEVGGKAFEPSKRLIASKVGSVAPRERIPDDVADAIFLRIQRNSQVGRYDSEDVILALGRRARRLDGDGTIMLFRAAPRGAGIRPGDFATESRHEAGFYRHGGHITTSASVLRRDVFEVDGSSGGGREFIFLPREYVRPEIAEFFPDFRSFHDLGIALCGPAQALQRDRFRTPAP